MSLIKCKECGENVSDSAVVCPHCGVQLKTSADYETKTVNIQCAGIISGKKSLEKKLNDFQKEGWEVVSYNHVRNPGYISFIQMYTVVLKRLKK